MECLDSMFGCIVIHGHLAVATESWWDLDPVERKLLVMAVSSNNHCSARDLPVFLPNKSPTVSTENTITKKFACIFLFQLIVIFSQVAFRLVSITLINGVQVLALCGPSPELAEVERLAVQCWRSNLEVLRTAEQSYPRNFPSTTTLDSGILALVQSYFIAGL